MSDNFGTLCTEVLRYCENVKINVKIAETLLKHFEGNTSVLKRHYIVSEKPKA